MRKDGLTLVARPEDVWGRRPVIPGDPVGVRLPAARPRALPGWYVVVSTHGQPCGGPLWRVYIAVRPARAGDALGLAASRLERTGARFQMKVNDRPSAIVRPDALVAFVERASLDAALGAAADLRRRGWLIDATPGFARRVAPGIALAIEPAAADGRSHGQRCADLVAGGLIAAWNAGLAGDPRTDQVVRCVEDGLDLEAP